MHEYAEIKGYRELENGTELKVFVPKDIREYLKKYQKGGKVESELRLDDPRYISSRQRKAIYATVNDISDWYGEVPEYLKELLKAYYMIEQDRKYFSLSNCSMTEARMFIDYLLEFALKHDVALSESGLERTDNIDRYLWMCLKHRKCCICGAKGELHHIDTIGMGNDRRTLDDSKHRKISLCRTHHTEAHTIGVDSFNAKYKVKGIVYKEGEIDGRLD
ncbi:putative HNHc nuclease [Acetoanaerobium noterae]|uniref:putative HNHc nuclease n=1 Tax=Acetoanaerobium noterae TaxID=745369 RepID=UPI0028A8B722|nr:putative HNHc nuclease [Acetoanaerobium noterae]